DPWAGELPVPRPRLNPYSRQDSIDPQPVVSLRDGAPGPDLRPSNLSQRPGGPRGQILYAVQNNARSVVVSANPDGTGGRVLLATLEENHCPVWSPDRSQVALAQLNSAPSGAPAIPGENSSGELAPGRVEDQPFADGIFILDPDSGKLREVSTPDGVPGVSQRFGRSTYGCPAWSPTSVEGGPYVAALVDMGRERFLALFPAGQAGILPGQPAQARYVSLGRAGEWSQPVWSSDGRKILMLRAGSYGAPPGLRVVYVPDDPEAPLAGVHFLGSWGSRAVSELAIAPDGKMLVELEGIGVAQTAHLHRINRSSRFGNNSVSSAVQLDPPAQTIEAGRLAWINANTFGVILRGGPADAFKSMFYLYNIETNIARPLLMFGDSVNSASWSPDGRWLIFRAESGLWGLDVARAVLGTDEIPVWLSPQPVQDLDWK
ncbi:MAG: hypothetical protein EHM21_09600, partial [Chloroflexi bacterium]